MQRIREKYEICRSGRYWFVAELCFMLGLIWISTPVIHGIVHFAEIDHGHPTGSFYEHASLARKSDQRPADAPWLSIDGDAVDTIDSVLADGVDPDVPDTPQPTRADLPVFYSLETVGFEPCEFDVSLSLELLACDAANFEGVGLLPSAELRTHGPRGPPA